MRKSKGKQVDLFYSNIDKKQPAKKNQKSTKEKSKVSKKSNNRSKVFKDSSKLLTKAEHRTERLSNKKDTNAIKLDNEIIIGINTKKEEKKKASNRKRGERAKKSGPKKGNKVNKIKKEVDIRKRKARLKIFKWTSIIILITIAVILFMLSSIFNIKDIKVNNNSKISSERIISLSEIKKDENMFKLNIWEMEENIKREPYISSVEIKRNLNCIVNINVEEREATYMLAFANRYVYINNQGYMLEISEEKLLVPMLTGFDTESKDIEPGKRLVESDLLKLGTVIKIMDSAKGNDIANLITSIDISDNQNYILKLDTEGKIVHFGDSSKINQKIIWIIGCVEQEKGIQGELFLENVNKPYFREKVKF